MECFFRHVAEKIPNVVTLRLYQTVNGTPRGDVIGPSSRHADNRSAICDARYCLEVPEAFATAIRMANSNDLELVVSGDQELWNRSWGVLR